MSDDFDELVQGWLKARGAVDGSALQALAGHVGALPPRRRSTRWAPLAAVATVAVAIGLAAFVIALRPGGVTGQPSAPLPPDPAAFAGDPRLARCGATVDSALDAFAMAHARDYRLHLPAMLLAPELDVDAPAFVVVYREMQSFPGGAPPPAGQTRPPRSLAPGIHDICVLVGADPATSERNVYDDVDIAGLTATISQLPEASLTPAPLSSAASPDPRSSPTPEPAPAWAADLAGQLGCDGPIAGIGGEVSDGVARDVIGATPADAIATFLAPPSPYGGLPTRGFMELHLETHWASYGHAVDGRTKAILVTSDVGQGRAPGWMVVGLRACDPSEFDPSIPLTYAITIWTDSSGSRVPTTAISSTPGPSHCGWESATFLWLDKVNYIRDPDGLSGHWQTPHYDPAATLPAKAQNRGYHSGGATLWIVPGGDAYLVYDGHTERWPRLDPSIGCT